MKLFTPRKTRSAKAASLRASGTLVNRLGERLSNGDVLLRLSICFVAMVLLALSVQCWRTPFPYRLGEVVPDGILARIDFKQVNDYRTENARREAQAKVPPVYTHEPARIAELRNALRSSLFAVADVNLPTELPVDAAAGFGFVADPLLEQEQQDQWRQLKKGVGTKEVAERRIDEILSEFADWMKPVELIGLIDPQELLRRELREEDALQVVSPNNPLELQEVPVGDTLLEELFKVSGKLGSRWKAYPHLEPLQAPLKRWLQQRAKPTLAYDEHRTLSAIEAARRGVSKVYDTYKQGSLLLKPGGVLHETALQNLLAQYEELEERTTWYQRLLRSLTVLLLLLVLAAMNGYYLVRNVPHLVRSAGNLSVYLTVVVVAVAVGQALSYDPWRAEVIPLLCAVMILAIAYSQILAAITGFSMTLVLTLSTGADVGQFVVLMSAVAVAALQLSQVSSRSKLIKVGFWTACTWMLVSSGIWLIGSQQFDRVWTDPQFWLQGLKGAGWCLAAGYLVAGSLPFVESAFGVVTDISLLELGDVSHPLLQELVRRAPGTYNHSIGVATISETAADAIGANGLLCRVGAYFHDIGKMLKPQYFIENIPVGTTSRHEHLNPAMSTLIIIGHVKDGVDLARQQSLPKPLIDFIEQHHGTTLVEYFYHQAAKQAESQRELRIEIEESSFRYPGPKPQSREAGVLMIADAVEGASRTLNDPTPKRIETLVHEITMKRLLDGQFEESSLTLSEISVIEETLTKSLIAIYHGRIKYPDQRTA